MMQNIFRAIKKRGCAARDKAMLDAIATMRMDELEDEMDRYISSCTAEQLSEEVLLAYDARCSELASSLSEYDLDVSWSRLQFRRSREEARTTSTSKGRRAFRVAEVFVAAAMFTTLVASAFDINPIAIFTDWVAGTFTLPQSETGGFNPPTDANSEYSSLPEALDAIGFEGQFIPTWIPSDYSLRSVEVIYSEPLVICTGYYISDARGEFYIEITSDASGDLAYTEEVVPGEGEVVTVGEQDYYILANSSNNKAIWRTGQYYCAYSGQLTFEELKQMISSID